MEQQKNSIDIAIENCTNIIQDYRKKSSFILLLIFMVTFTFLMIVGYSTFRGYFYGTKANPYLDTHSIRKNDFIAKIENIKDITKQDYDTLITKAISYQKLLNTEYEGELDFRKKMIVGEQPDFSSYILYGIFVLIFGVLTSFYRFFLKEISKQEHYLVGFYRIRVAGNNSTTKYDDEVKTALTQNAFNYENSLNLKKTSKIESPIPGHPTSDITTILLNKILNQLDFKSKDKKDS